MLLRRVAPALDVVASISLIAASAALVWVALGGGTRQGREVPRAAPPSYEVGEPFAAVPGLRFDAAPQTLVVWVRSTCRYCTESMGFYRRGGGEAAGSVGSGTPPLRLDS